MKRGRPRHYRSGPNNGNSAVRGGNQPQYNRNHVFESNGPEGRIRGTAQQLSEKYQQLGRDAAGSGDRVQAQACFQHAEHYLRIFSEVSQAAQQERAERQRQYEQQKAERAERREKREPRSEASEGDEKQTTEEESAPWRPSVDPVEEEK